MHEKNLASAIAYYSAMNNKDIEGMAKYLHTEVELISPLARVLGKDAVLESAKRLFAAFTSLKIRAKFSEGNQVMLAMDMDCVQPIGLLRSAVLMTFENGLIARNELFLDARGFER